MKGDYPRFRATYAHEELVEHFLLQPDEVEFVRSFRSEVNRNGVAVLVKALAYLGYVPPSFESVPEVVRTFIARQLDLLWDQTSMYPWESSTRDHHLAQIRHQTGWRFATAQDKTDLEQWLQIHVAPDHATSEDLLEAAYTRCRQFQIELPAEQELRRLVNAALQRSFQVLYDRITARVTAASRTALDALLLVPADAAVSVFEQLKAEPAKPSVENLKKEIRKLQTLRATGITESHVADVADQTQRVLQRRATNERVGEMRDHPESIRYALMTCFVAVRMQEVTDDITRMTMQMLHRIDVRTEQQLHREFLQDMKRVAGKMQLLFRIAEAVVEQPDGTVRQVLFPRVKEDTFHDLVTEFRASGLQYRRIYQTLMRNKYGRHYRRMLPLILEHLTFRSDNRFQPVIDALAVIKRYWGTAHEYLPEEVPLEGVVPSSWTDLVLEQKGDEQKINRHAYELCVLQQLERALKCKEIWVEGASTFRNPHQDLPKNWQHEPTRVQFYHTLQQPLEAETFVTTLRTRLTTALTAFNRTVPQNPTVSITTAPGNAERGLFSVTPLDAQPEPQHLRQIKDALARRYGMLDLLDVFVEADRLANFTRFFTHSGTKEVRSRAMLRPLLLLALFAEGTNTGIKRVVKANQQYNYDELLYVRKMYVSVNALRQANRAVVNTLLAMRNPRLWGEGSSCASDGKRFESWSQNLMTEWRSRYKGYGVLVYWHVETNAVCIYSQLRSFSSSEVAAMIEGLIRHDTEMRIEKNFVDSHGQSEVAFAFCHLLGEVRLMPRLKRIKYERLYLPDTGMSGDFPHLSGVLTRPIRWPLITQQYDEMIKHTVALKTGTATAEAILRRFNSYNVTHPTYKALAEVGKVEKTIYLCDYLSDIALRYEVQEGLNGVERWNGANDFVRYGRHGLFATNSREQQEISVLALQLLQNCLMLINTILVERTIEEQKLWDTLSAEDRRALTPLLYEHINPYGWFTLDLERPSFLVEERQ